MLFAFVFLIGIAFPILFFKARANWLKWLPAVIFLFFTLLIGAKILFFPAPEMAVLGEIIYFMLLGCAALGSIVSGIMMHYLKKIR